MKKYFAELVGTFILVLFGCGTAVVAGDKVGIVGIALAFGLALIGAAYGIGPVSGCHINPAVSLGVWAAGRMSIKDMVGYWVGQFAGAILAAWVLSFYIVGGIPGGYNLAANGLGQNGWGPGYQGEYNLASAIAFEFVATLIFVIVILGSTQKSAPAGFAGLGIGITLVAIHLFGIHITGTSVNPARSFGPALFVGGHALSQVWLFLLIPSLGGLVAGFLYRIGVLSGESLSLTAGAHKSSVGFAAAAEAQATADSSGGPRAV
ncbi:MAG: aquaporin [Terracidiphilus sp.]